MITLRIEGFIFCIDVTTIIDRGRRVERWSCGLPFVTSTYEDLEAVCHRIAREGAV